MRALHSFLAGALLLVAATAHAQAKKPNILILWGDDIGYWNVSAYNQGMMGYRTPNIDRIAREGALFTDWYGQQSCTAGRATFITGQSPFRTGLLKVGLPGAKEGLQKEDVTIAELLKAQGYATGQFGKNHLGDLDDQLPTMHGFDEFMGSLYHLNAEDEPEHPDYFKDPELKKKYGTRGVIHTWAQPGGKQKIESTGPLTKKRMETVDAEITKEAIRFMKEAKAANKPFFMWWNSTRMHIWTRLTKESQGKTGLGVYPDGMVEHDAQVGEMLKALDELGLADDTIVMYSTDNGAEVFTWPDGGQTPFRGEKNTNWEGGFRVPCAIRWPGLIRPGTVLQRHLRARGHAAHPGGRGRRSEREGEAAQGHERRRQDLQEPPRRLRHARHVAGKAPEPAQGVLLLQRRRLARRGPLQPVEARLRRAAQPQPRRLAGPVRAAAAAEALQPALRPVRDRR